MGSSNDNLRSFLAGLFRTAVSAAHPATCLPPLLPALPSGQLILLAAGKAAGSMAETAEAHYLDRRRTAAERLTGVAVARHGYARHLRKVRMIEAGHPIPDAAGLEAADRALALADGAGADDLARRSPLDDIQRREHDRRDHPAREGENGEPGRLGQGRSALVLDPRFRDKERTPIASVKLNNHIAKWTITRMIRIDE